MVQQEQEKRSVESCTQPFGGAGWVKRRKSKKDLLAQVQPTLLSRCHKRNLDENKKEKSERERRLVQSKHRAPLVAAFAIASSNL
jgi:hypothetical protein